MQECNPPRDSWTPPRKGSAAIPGFIRLGEALSGGGNGCPDALPAGGGDSLAGGCGQGHGVRIAGHAGGRKWTMPVGTLALHGDLDPSTCY
jgi:hypothetical protein